MPSTLWFGPGGIIMPPAVFYGHSEFRRRTMLKIDVEAIARVGRDAYARAWNKNHGKSVFTTVFFWDKLSPEGRAAEMAEVRSALGELARQVRVVRQGTGCLTVQELEAAAEAPDTTALDEARRKLREAEDAQGKAAEAVRAARAQVDAIERG
jgi:hypothetical protein